jgi:hypothetical protein
MILDKSDIVDFVDQLLMIDNDCLKTDRYLIKRAVHPFFLFSEEFDYFITSGSLSYHMSK